MHAQCVLVFSVDAPSTLTHSDSRPSQRRDDANELQPRARLERAHYSFPCRRLQRAASRASHKATRRHVTGLKDVSRGFRASLLAAARLPNLRDHFTKIRLDYQTHPNTIRNNKRLVDARTTTTTADRNSASGAEPSAGSTADRGLDTAVRPGGSFLVPKSDFDASPARA